MMTAFISVNFYGGGYIFDLCMTFIVLFPSLISYTVYKRIKKLHVCCSFNRNELQKMTYDDDDNQYKNQAKLCRLQTKKRKKICCQSCISICQLNRFDFFSLLFKIDRDLSEILTKKK